MSAEAKLQLMVCPACNSRYEEGGAFCSRDGTPLVIDPQAGKADLVGQVLAERYRVIRLVGEGGMGQVYEAQHVNINKRFAVKLLRPEITSNAEAVARFRQEAWSASSIGHENIIEIEDFATLPNGSVYLAMEFLSGLALSDRMRQEPALTFGEALDVMLQVSSGLAAAHDKGIVHRDMKPENIFLGQKYGRPLVKILDFGIAKVSGAEGNRSLTRTGTIFGTPHYMSPEQALGKPLDHRADIYSVGVIMYELFTGRVPFEAESFMGILTKHITSQPKRPREAAPERDIAESVEAIILRALSKEPEDRQQSMAELSGELATVAAELAPEVLQPRPASLALAQISKPLSSVMPARTPTPMPRVPSGATPMPRMPSGAQSVSGPIVDGAGDVDVPAKKRSATPWIAVAAMVLIGGAGAVVWGTRTPAGTSVVQPTTPPTPAVVQPVATPPVAQPTPPPKAPELEDVIVDSIPPGAKIYVDGVAVAEAPEAIKVEKGKTKAVTLKKDGYADKEQTADPSVTRKLVVRLEKLKHGSGVKAGPPVKSKLPSPPPVALDPPPKSPPPVATPPRQGTAVTAPPPKKKKVVDPYERVDEKKGGDVLNPY
ncbi:MAG: hypothetical protein JWN44_572 [Myxococcales bacterium]|nr:hypothetical protein [Myxococcales bacterium]